MTTSRARRAFVCYKCTPPQRTFLLAGAPDTPAPRCATHGKMDAQPNVKYVRGRYITGPKMVGAPS